MHPIQRCQENVLHHVIDISAPSKQAKRKSTNARGVKGDELLKRQSRSKMLFAAVLQSDPFAVHACRCFQKG